MTDTVPGRPKRDLNPRPGPVRSRSPYLARPLPHGMTGVAANAAVPRCEKWPYGVVASGEDSLAHAVRPGSLVCRAPYFCVGWREREVGGAAGDR